jgi:hypothetical protein
VGSLSTFNSKRRFAVKLIAFFVLLFILDAVFGGLLKFFYFRQKSGLNYRLTYAIDHTTDEVLVLGSSRAQAHYVPSIIEKNLGKSCYNAGRDGQNLLFSYAVHQAVIKRYHPDIIILDLIPRDFFKIDVHYDRLSLLLPYYDSHDEIRPIVHLRNRFERIKLMSRIYPYNSMPITIAKYNLVEDAEQDGYVPVFGEMTPLMQHEEEEVPFWQNAGFDPNMIHAFETIIATCMESDIQLYVVISPHYLGEAPGMSSLPKVIEILGESPYELWDYSNHPDFTGQYKLFRDRSHLNNVGAKLFSKILAEKLKMEVQAASI